jgi:5-methylcytosine-specific restriction endonuclease McrA
MTTAQREYDRRYKEANREKLAALAREYYWEHLSKVRARQKEYREGNKPAHAQRLRTWMKNNPGASRAARESPEIRERLRSAPPFTTRDVSDHLKIQSGRCYWCNCQLGSTYEMDHLIPISKGGGNSRDNVRAACVTCNRKKGDRLPMDFVLKMLGA